MRTRILAASVAAVAMLLPLSAMTAASASPAATKDVLTTGKVGGPNVKVGAILQAGLATHATAVFASGTAIIITCKTSSFTAKVTKNPTKPGTATSKITGQKFGSCKGSGSLGGFISTITITLVHLPTSTTSDKPGFPVTVLGPTTKVVAVVPILKKTITCFFHANTVLGHASNKSQTVTFVKQKLSVAAGSNKMCTASTFSAVYGPVLDLSVAHNPHVFVN